MSSYRRGNPGPILGVALTFECKEPAMFAKECALGGRFCQARPAFLPGLPSDGSPGQFRVLPRNCVSGRTDHQEAQSLVQNGSKKRTEVGIC
jgi:hypothetical protein